MKINKKVKIIAGMTVVIMLVSGTAYVMVKKNNTSQAGFTPQKTDVLAVSSYVDEKSGIKVDIPTEAEKLEITENDIKDGIFLRLQSKSSPEYFMNMRIERGLRIPVQLARLEVLDLVVDGALRSLPARYPEFSLISEDKLEIAGESAKSITFSYKGPSGAQITQVVSLVALDSDRALYISQQAKSQDFATLEKEIFSSILSSISTR